MRSLWIAFSPRLALACAHGAAVTAERADEPSPVRDEEARRARRSHPRPSVPRVASAATRAPPEPWLVVGTRAIWMGEGAPIVALEDGRVRSTDRGDADRSSIVLLRERFSRASEPAGPLGVAIDPGVPFRTALAVVDTLGETARGELALLVAPRRGEPVARSTGFAPQPATERQKAPILRP